MIVTIATSCVMATPHHHERMGLLIGCLDLDDASDPGDAESPASPIRVSRPRYYCASLSPQSSRSSLSDSDTASPCKNKRRPSDPKPRHPLEHEHTERFLAADLLRRVQAGQRAALEDGKIEANCWGRRSSSSTSASPEHASCEQLARALDKLHRVTRQSPGEGDRDKDYSSRESSESTHDETDIHRLDCVRRMPAQLLTAALHLLT